MVIRFSSAFRRMYRKLPPDLRNRAERALQLFGHAPFDPKLRNHKLSGSKEGMRSITAGYDLRLVYIEEDGHALILFIMVGTHDAVY